MARKARQQPHVRLYRHELECDAYRSLSTDARALLVEFRALYKGQDNRVYMSRREMQRRLGVGRYRAEAAREELLDRGFIRMLAKGSFSRKVRHASEYALTNEPLENKDGATPPKDFMKWQPQKNTGLVSNPDGAGEQPREPSQRGEKHRHGAGEQPRQSLNRHMHVAGEQPTDKLPRSTSFLMPALRASSEAQFKLIVAAMLLEAKA